MACDANIPRTTMPSTAPPTAAINATATTTGVSIGTSRPATRAGGDRCHAAGPPPVVANGDIDRWAGRGHCDRRLPGLRVARATRVEIWDVAYYGAAGWAGPPKGRPLRGGVTAGPAPPGTRR